MLDFDILFVGGGPANLTAAIHLHHLVSRHNLEGGRDVPAPEIAVIEKGRYPGAHLLSGAVVDPRALMEFLPDYRERGCPLGPEVTRETLCFLTEKKQFTFPFIPESFRNEGNYLVSLSRFGSWLAGIAESLGIVILDHTAALSPVIEQGAVAGIMTDEKGRGKDGSLKPGFEPGMMLRAAVTVFGEGPDGSMFNQLDRIFALNPENTGQTYETGVKEVWRIPSGRMETGRVMHSFGYPLTSGTYGGGWMYALSETELSLGFVTSVSRHAPLVDPHLNLQKFKEHPAIASAISGGSLVEYGAKTITSGGLDAMPRIFGPGFLITGESAGLVNMQRLKGIHLAVKSGILAAETLFEALARHDFSLPSLQTYAERFERSWAFSEMQASKNYRRAFDGGLYKGLLHSGLKLAFPGFTPGAGRKKKGPADVGGNALKDRDVFSGKVPAFTADGMLTFDKAHCLFHSGTAHEEDQPCHLVIKPEDVENICLVRCTTEFGNPCRFFCPADVYEVTDRPTPSFRLNPSNCLHCKTCEIADPYGVILWKVPEGGGGPGYKLS
jgi:electron-transferring-flavoprotein dehydrogenase